MYTDIQIMNSLPLVSDMKLNNTALPLSVTHQHFIASTNNVSTNAAANGSSSSNNNSSPNIKYLKGNVGARPATEQQYTTQGTIPTTYHSNHNHYRNNSNGCSLVNVKTNRRQQVNYNNGSNNTVGNMPRKRYHQHYHNQQQQQQQKQFTTEGQSSNSNKYNNNNSTYMKNQNLPDAINGDILLPSGCGGAAKLMAAATLTHSCNNSYTDCFGNISNHNNNIYCQQETTVPPTPPAITKTFEKGVETTPPPPPPPLSTSSRGSCSTYKNTRISSHYPKDSCSSCTANYTKNQEVCVKIPSHSAKSAPVADGVKKNNRNNSFVQQPPAVPKGVSSIRLNNSNSNSNRKKLSWKCSHNSAAPISLVAHANNNNSPQQAQSVAEAHTKQPQASSKFPSSDSALPAASGISNNPYNNGASEAASTSVEEFLANASVAVGLCNVANGIAAGDKPLQLAALLKTTEMTTALTAVTSRTITTEATANTPTVSTTSAQAANPTITTAIEAASKPPTLEPTSTVYGDSTTSVAVECPPITQTTATLKPPTTSTEKKTAAGKTPNSYSADFLHSVAAEMTGNSNFLPSKANQRPTGRDGIVYDSGTADSAGVGSMRNRPVIRPAYNVNPHMLGGGASRQQHAQQQQQRYLAGNIASSTNRTGYYQSNNSNNHHQSQHHHHHHQPQQLTIASFLQKDLLEEMLMRGNDCSNATDGSSNYSHQQQQHYAPAGQHRYQNYYHSYYSQQQQQQHSYATIQQAVNYNGASTSIDGRLHGYTNYNSNLNNGNNNKASQQQQQQQHQQQQQQTQLQNTEKAAPAQHQSTGGKKNSNCVCSSISSCSSSVSSSSSASSLQSQASSKAARTQKMKMQIETLPTSKTQRNTHHHRTHHAVHQNHYHQHHHNSGQQQRKTMDIAPPTPQHQNFYNLTYVNTENDEPAAAADNATLGQEVAAAVMQPDNSYQTQLQQQQSFNHVTAAGTLAPSSTTTLCCAQLDEASSTAAAFSSSVSSNVKPLTAGTSSAGNDYDSAPLSSSASNNGDAAAANVLNLAKTHANAYQPMPAAAYSSSSSLSSLSVLESNVATPTPAGTPVLRCPMDFMYTMLPPPQPAMAEQQQSQIASPRHYHEPCGSLLNTATHNYSEDELTALQQQQPQSLYLTPSDKLAPSGNGNDGNAVGYWNPLEQVNFFYGQTGSAANLLPSNVSSPDSLSPGLLEPEDDIVSGSSVASSLSEKSEANRRGGSRSRNHHQHMTPSLAAMPQNYKHPPPPSHQGAATNPINANPANYQMSAIDLYAPSDRLLERAHLIEVKEAPATLLNNSRWDNLSHTIWQKFVGAQQTEYKFKQKMQLWRCLYVIIKTQRYGLYLVGSTISGFGLNTSDVDMCLVSRSVPSVDPRMEAIFHLTIVRDCLSKTGEFENFNLIEAKVPILRFRDRIHHLEVDLNFNNSVGIKNTHLLYCYSQLDWRLRPLVLVTKLWAQHHHINNAKNMTISSYSLVLMVIHFLQYAVSPPVLPCLHDLYPEKFPLLRCNDFGYIDMNETMAPYESKNVQALGELFLDFLEYYSCFDYAQYAISVRTGGLIPINICRQAKSPKNDIHQWKALCIEEPFDLTNTARSVYDYDTFERVKAVFTASWQILQESLDLNSLFAQIILPPIVVDASAAKFTGNRPMYHNINNNTNDGVEVGCHLPQPPVDVRAYGRDPVELNANNGNNNYCMTSNHGTNNTSDKSNNCSSHKNQLSALIS